MTHEELFVSSGLFAVLVAGSVTYTGGEWIGLQLRPLALGTLLPHLQQHAPGSGARDGLM